MIESVPITVIVDQTEVVASLEVVRLTIDQIRMTVWFGLGLISTITTFMYWKFKG